MRKNIVRFSSAVVTLALAVGTLWASGCHSPAASSLCKDICTCKPCTDNDLRKCENQADKSQKDASDLGCATPFDAYLACALDTVGCDGTAVKITGCDPQLKALSTCTKGKALPGGDACTLAAAALTACVPSSTTTTSSGSTMVACTGAALCTATCINNATCAELTQLFGGNPGPGNAALACLQACTNSSTSGGTTGVGGSAGGSVGSAVSVGSSGTGF